MDFILGEARLADTLRKSCVELRQRNLHYFDDLYCFGKGLSYASVTVWDPSPGAISDICFSLSLCFCSLRGKKEEEKVDFFVVVAFPEPEEKLQVHWAIFTSLRNTVI